MNDLIIERRRTRSPLTHEALQMQLEAVCQSWGFDAMVLTDDDGQVVAGAGQLARPIATADPAAGRTSVDLAALIAGPAPTTVRPIAVDGLQGQVVVLGERSAPVDDAVAHAARGVERILRTTSPVPRPAPTHFVI